MRRASAAGVLCWNVNLLSDATRVRSVRGRNDAASDGPRSAFLACAVDESSPGARTTQRIRCPASDARLNAARAPPARAGIPARADDDATRYASPREHVQHPAAAHGGGGAMRRRRRRRRRLRDAAAVAVAPGGERARALGGDAVRARRRRDRDDVPGRRVPASAHGEVLETRPRCVRDRPRERRRKRAGTSPRASVALERSRNVAPPARARSKT